MIKWNEKSINWFLAASAYTGYNSKLAALLRHRIQETETLCDLGCGMGLVDFELAPHFRRVHCVDIDATVIDFVNRRAAETKTANLSGSVCNAREMEGRWDTVITLFHGKPEDFAERYVNLAKSRLIAVVHGAPRGNLGPEAYRVKKFNDMENTARLLDAKKIKYQVFPDRLEFGQPLKSREDAAEFAKAYTQSPTDLAVAEYLDDALVETGEKEFPFYLPNLREFAIFTIEGRGA